MASQNLSGNQEKQASRLLHRIRRINWTLLSGSLVVLLLLILAYKGPDWAPKDPLKENYSLRVDGKIVRPPYDPLSVEGYPLGTDQFGRDLLSRLLWAVRPTLIMVSVVAVVRLVLGIILGLVIGWSAGFLGKLLDAILSGALSIPALIVALIGITAIGVEKGLMAFVLGMAITGWAETARLVSEQTRTIKGQVYIEAAQALGASDGRVLLTHVLRQITPLVWMLIAFEASATLLITAELGFLGYYIGGGVWVEITDFQVVNAAGLPELGQMLSTALVSLVKPWVLIIIGSVMFLAILGFNLLGEGLNVQIRRQMVYGRGRSYLLGRRVGEWIEDKFTIPAGLWVEANRTRIGLVGLVAVLFAGWTLWWNSRPVSIPAQEQVHLSVAGGHWWAAERRDMQGSKWTPASGPKTPQTVWLYPAGSGFSGGPVINADGTVYASTLDKALIALSRSGEEVWRAVLPEIPVGTPALGPDGKIYVTDRSGGLSAYDPEGNLAWTYSQKSRREATSGPIVASNGTVYYTRADIIQAVSPEGDALWQASPLDRYVESAPILSAGESFLFLFEAALAAENGAALVLDGLEMNELQFTAPAFFVGGDTKTYFRTGHSVYGWRSTQAGVEVDQAIGWEGQGQVAIFPVDQGAVPDGAVWLFYSGDFFDTRLVWLDKESKITGNYRSSDRESTLIGIDRDAVAYLCSNNFGINPNCQALPRGSTSPTWKLDLVGGVRVTGGALAPDRMYITTDVGTLYAIGAGDN